MNHEKINRILTTLICIIMGISVGMIIMYVTMTGGASASSDSTIAAGKAKYQEIIDLVDTYYIGDDVDYDAVNDGMASGMIEGVGDRWSYYVSAEEYQDYLNNINNSFVGVGMTISASYDDYGNLQGFEVASVTEGGGAEESGVQSGDILTHVDGTDVTESTITEVKELVQGEEGSTVSLTFLRDGTEYTVSAERKALTIEAATGEMLDGNIAYVKIVNFDAGCADTVKSLVEEFQEQGAEALLFDVRNNPGGLKSELTDLLDYLLPEGTIFHTVDYSGKEEIVTSDASCVDLPMAVLVNASSYSAAEYFACALQEYGVGKVVGVQTYGKGYYQVGLQLSDGSCVNLSIGKYFTPNGESLIGTGVTPDEVVELTTEQQELYSSGKLSIEDDPQLQAALSILYGE